MSGSYVVHERLRSLTAATPKTMAQLLTPSTRRLVIVSYSVGFTGVTSTDQPMSVDLLRQTSAGTMTDFGTEIPSDPAMVPSVVTATVNATAEPTAGDILVPHVITPNGGMWEKEWLPDDDIVVPVSARIGLRITPGASATSVLATVSIRWREIS